MRLHTLSLLIGCALGLALALTLTHSPASAKKQKKQNNCWDTAETQMELNACAGLNAQKADVAMKRVLDRIAKVYKTHPVFLDRLAASQKAWERYRSAHLEARFPLDDKDTYSWGTVHSMCESSEHSGLAHVRAKTLLDWLSPETLDEGDLCTGSYGLRDE